MVFGPYDTTYGQGHHTAQFKLMVDNNSGSDVVGSLDVVTGYGGNVLATRQVRRSDFTSANQWQTFTLQFDNPCFGLVEARVWWAGNANMRLKAGVRPAICAIWSLIAYGLQRVRCPSGND